MKYLIKNRKEFAISVGFFIMTAISLIKAIMAREINEDLVIAFVYAFFGVLAWFYNMPTSEENCKHTGEMRQEKLEKAKAILGEYFYSDDEVPFDEEDENEEAIEDEQQQDI